MDASMLEAMEMYRTPAAGEKVEKLDVHEVLGRTEKPFFEKLSSTRRAYVAARLGNDPLAGPEGDLERADDVAFSLRGRVVVITGASRGIGEAIAVRFAGQGARVVVLSQTTKENPALPGTVYDTVKACVDAGGDAIAIKTDIRDEGEVQAAIREAMMHYDGVIDILVNCASTHFPQKCAELDDRRYDQLNDVNVKGTLIVSAACAPYLRNSKNPHVVTIAPAPRADKEWLAPHAAYSASKIAMAFVSRRLQSELGSSNVACNTLWPRFAVATAATNFIGGERLVSMSRTPACVADAAFRIVTAPSRLVQNKHFVDQDVLRAAGVDDFKPYNVDPDVVEPVDDFFLVSSERGVPAYAKPPPPDPVSGDVVLSVAKSAEEERREKERRDVVLVLVDWRDVKTYVALFSALTADRPNRKLVVAAHKDAAPVLPYTERLRFIDNDLQPSGDTLPFFRDDRFRAFVGDMRVAANVSKLVELASRAFYGVDAVVDATTHRPHLDWEPIDMSSSTSVTYDRHFDVCVRASFFFVRDLLPHLLKSSGARRVVSVTPPPRCDVFDEEERGVVALARLMRGAHVRGIAAELADANPPVSLVGVWSDALASKADGSFVKGGDEVAQRKDVFGKDAVARAAAKLVDADAKSVSSGSFWRAEDIVAPLPLKNDVFPEKIEETVVAPSSEPTYEDARFEFPDVAELLAEELARLTPPDAEDEDWQLV
jgi:citronellol/citronellal dehydrogenase